MLARIVMVTAIGPIAGFLLCSKVLGLDVWWSLLLGGWGGVFIGFSIGKYMDDKNEEVLGADAGLAREWPREGCRERQEAQVDKPGG